MLEPPFWYSSWIKGEYAWVREGKEFIIRIWLELHYSYHLAQLKIVEDFVVVCA